MGTPYTTTPTTAASPSPVGWQSEMRSVTPATNNTRYTGRYTAGGGAPSPQQPSFGAGNSPASMATNEYRNMTPTTGGGRFASLYHHGRPRSGVTPATPNNDKDNAAGDGGPRTPSSTGLIRLSLKKPMGIVFEPMYDPNAPAVQRGVRICDLPRTGAAALSRKLQVGDELLQINDTTVSRMTFDEIMDFIIEADPESVSLLFRRPRKETLQARQGVPQKLNAAANKDNPSTVKWVDEKDGSVSDNGNNNNNNKRGRGDKKSKKSKKSSSRSSSRNKKGSISEEEETLASTLGDESYEKRHSSSRHHHRSKKSKSSRHRGPYETESFLDLLIDTICSNSNNMCRDAFRTKDDDYSEDDETLGSDLDDYTTGTYEESVQSRGRNKNSSGGDNAASSYDDDDDDLSKEEKLRRKSKKDKKDKATAGGGDSHHHHHHHHGKNNNSSSNNNNSSSNKKQQGGYEDDGTLETVDSAERAKQQAADQQQHHQPPLGLAPNLSPEPVVAAAVGGIPAVPADAATQDDATNPNAPIKEVEYDDRIDHGADVSVMESLGGPSLLIEKQRAAVQQQASTPIQHSQPKNSVPDDVLQQFGLDYPASFGLTREQTIQNDPLKFYTYVVKQLLQEHEPEKVRLLDKLLAKYKGREDHLVQKLSMRYNRAVAAAAAANETADDARHDNFAFSDAVKKTKTSSNVVAAVNLAKDRLHNTTTTPASTHATSTALSAGLHDHQGHEWPEKEEKEPDMLDRQHPEEEESTDESGSEYSRDSVDGTSPAVIAQVSELLNYVYGKTSVPGQIDRVSTIMRAYEGREAVLLELLETKALIKANKEKENADNLPSFLRNSHMSSQAQKNAEELEANAANTSTNASNSNLPPVTPLATTAAAAGSSGQGGTVINDDISSMSGVSSPAAPERDSHGITATAHEIEAAPVTMTTPTTPTTTTTAKEDPRPMKETPKINATASMKSGATTGVGRPPVTPGEKDKRKKKGLFGGLFGKKKRHGGADGTESAATPNSRMSSSRSKRR